jgi:formylglycine-generating enzyme required for sulfatase activity
MKSQGAVWPLLAALLVVCGLMGCGSKSPTGAKDESGAGGSGAAADKQDGAEIPKVELDAAADALKATSPEAIEAREAAEKRAAEAAAVAAKRAARAKRVAQYMAETAPALAAQRECSQRLGVPVELTNSVGMTLTLIPAGEFLMGSPKSDSSLWETTWPQHRVQISKPFYMGVTEVTQWQYKQVTGKVLSRGESNPECPVEYVSWEEAVYFCTRLSDKEGRSYRLPTEAEWEYACRAGTTTKWHCGDDEKELTRLAWYEGDRDGAQPVARKEANAWGLFDMHGNVMEWCRDGYRTYTEDDLIDPTGPADAMDRVIRGGCWRDEAKNCQSACRGRFLPDEQGRALGFRVVAEPSG